MKAKVLISVLAMLLCSVGAFADNYDISTGNVVISTGGTHTITGTTTTYTIVVNTGVTADITIQDVNIDVSATNNACAFSIADGATVNLTLSGNNVLKSGWYKAGLSVPDNATLTIDGTSSDKLEATGSGDGGAGIGGGLDSSGSITINGGTVTATGGIGGNAGIGGGKGSSGGIITINGGTVTAIGGDGGAGIGSGNNGRLESCTITISGGTVTATGGTYGAGIGGGYNVSGGGKDNSGGSITISGGTVTANSSAYGGAGIGGGDGGSGGIINISGGIVTAIGWAGGAGIGGGSSNHGGAITISGGTVEATGINGGAGIGIGVNMSIYDTGGTTIISGGSVSGGRVVPQPTNGTGGSVSPSPGNYLKSVQATNSSSENVFLNTLTIGVSDKSVTAGSINGEACDETPDAAAGVYGIKDVKTDDNGKVYLYLPASNGDEPVTLTVDGVFYEMTYTRASDDYSNAKTLEATYGIELDQAGTNDFGEDTYGYANAPTELTVTVSNVDDNNATGDLTVALSGDNAGSFTLSKASINSIAVGADDSFTVEPNGNLPAGTHTATVTVENDNVSESFDVSFTVNPKDITVTNFSIDTKIYDGTDAAEVAAVTFGGLEYGDNLTIDVDYTVSATFNDFNAGTGKTVTATVTLTTTDAAKNYNLTNGEDYPLTSQAISVKALTIDNFTIATKVYDGTTNAEVTGVTFGGLENDEILTVDVDYTVSAAFEDASLGTGKKVTATVTMQSTDKANNYNLAVATKELTGQSIVLLYYGVELDRTGMQTFTTAPYGYTQPELDVEVSNTGNDVTGDLTVDLSGADAGSFTLSETSITSIEVSEAGSFTVAPQPGLSVGTYTATVTVSSSAHSISETFDVEFTVTQKAITVTPDAKSKLYGQSDPALTYTCAPALVAGDEFTGTLSRAAGENLGTYLIGQNTLALSSNYQLTFTTGVLFTINPTNPRLLQDLEDAIICAGESYTFKIVAEGDNLSYEWYHGNERINGVNGNTYTITNAESGNSGRYYVIVRSDLGSYRSSVYSKEVNLWVTGQLPETLRFTEFPSTAVTGQTYRIKLAGYSDVTQYLWSYDRDGVTFSPVTGGVGNNETLATFGSLSVGQGLLTVTLEHPCGTRQATQAILVQYPTGVEQVAEQAVRVFPNPTAGIIKVSGTKSSQIIRVVDMTGSLKGTYPARDGETTIDLSGYAQGTYLIQYNGKTIKAVRK